VIIRRKNLNERKVGKNERNNADEYCMDDSSSYGLSDFFPGANKDNRETGSWAWRQVRVLFPAISDILY